MIDPEVLDTVVAGLDRDHILDIAEMIKVELATGRAVEAAYMPGDATWYALLFVRPSLTSAPGGGRGNDFHIPSQIGTSNRTYVSWLQRSTWTSFDTLDDAIWVAGKLSPDNVASQIAIAELLKEVM